MANGWTNANNFKPWTQYDITPSTEDIVIPKGSYLSQDIVVHGDPNYASCNIKQGVSVGDIEYGSANTAIDSFGCGIYYPNNIRTPYGIYDNLMNGQTTNDFNNHMIGRVKDGIIFFYPKTGKLVSYKVDTQYIHSSIDDMTNGRTYSSILQLYNDNFVSCVSNAQSGTIKGRWANEYNVFNPCTFADADFIDYSTCFLYPINHNKNCGIGLIQNGSQYAVIYALSIYGLSLWWLYRTFSLSQKFAGVAIKDNSSLLILFDRGTVYEVPFELTESGKTSPPIISTSAYSMTDLCSNNESEIYAIGKNSIYRLLNNQWVQIDLSVAWGYYGACIDINSTDINYTQWITYDTNGQIFYIGSSNALYRFGMFDNRVSDFNFDTNAHCWLNNDCYAYGNFLFHNRTVVPPNNSVKLIIRG